MALAETAHVAVQMDLTGNFGAAIKTAAADVERFAATAGSAAVANVGKLEKGLNNLGGALGHAKSQIGGLLTGPIGILGLGAGLFTLGGAIEKGITMATDFGLEVSKLTALTGESADSISALASAFEHFGLSSDSTLRSIGFLEKNVGLLVAKKDGLKNFTKEFGVSLTDANGHVKDASALILTLSDYFNNKMIPATTKAAALAKLFGRSWQELIPLLSAGSKGILDAEAAAAQLGLTLNATNVADLAKFKDSTRELGTAVGGLELQIGLALVPELQKLATEATKFISQNRTGIVAFFRDGAKNVEAFGKFLADDVLPPLRTLGTIAAAAWNTIPDPLKQILIGGIIANKAGKFLFDINIAGDLTKSLAGAAGSFFGRGGSPATPLFVSDVSGGLGGVASAAGGISAASLAALAAVAAVPLIPLVAAYFLAGGAGGIDQKDLAGRQATAAARGLNPALVPSSFAGRNAPNTFANWQAQRNAAIAGNNFDKEARDAMGVVSGLQDIKDASQGTAAQIRAMAQAVVHLTGWYAESAKTLKDEIAKRSAAKFGGSGLGSAAVNATFERDLLRKAEGIAKTGDASAAHLAKLKALEAQAVAAKDYGVGRRVAALEAALKAKKLSVSTHTTVNVSTKVSWQALNGTMQVYQRYNNSTQDRRI